MISFEMIARRTWASEDAFIFFRYVQNLVQGHGLVFNLNERVEGFTAPLWVFLLAIMQHLTGANLRPLAIVIGYILSLTTLAIILFRDADSKSKFYPLAVVLLITTSAFRDFATSGFETSLTYLLLVIFITEFKKGYLFKKSFFLGIAISLLVLNRPEAFLLFAYCSILYLVEIIISFQDKKAIVPKIKHAFNYLSAAILILLPYQIFRMGYYASFLPNTFYAKKGGSLYLSQGLNYILDFILSYKLTMIVLTILAIVFLINMKMKWVEDIYHKSRLHIFIMALLLLGYVLYAGGDYMHGRSLLMFFITLAVMLNDFTEKLITKFAHNFSHPELVYSSSLAALFILFLICQNQLPITVKALKQINNIDDERHRFGNDFDMVYLKQLLEIPITSELGWRDRGFYYNEISRVLALPISVVNTNIGFFGYAAGDQVSVYGAHLIDPYLARKSLKVRGKIGHETEIDQAYILSRKPTFSYTPFKYWNEHAHFKLASAPHSFVIKDDSDDSYIPIFDLSNEKFLAKYSQLMNTDIKKSIDDSQVTYLTDLKSGLSTKYSDETNEYLGFLKLYWYPYADEHSRSLYDSINRYGYKSKYELYNDKYTTRDKLFLDRIQSKLTPELFKSNIMFALKDISGNYFEE